MIHSRFYVSSEFGRESTLSRAYTLVKLEVFCSVVTTRDRVQVLRTEHTNGLFFSNYCFKKKQNNHKTKQVTYRQRCQEERLKTRSQMHTSCCIKLKQASLWKTCSHMLRPNTKEYPVLDTDEKKNTICRKKNKKSKKKKQPAESTRSMYSLCQLFTIAGALCPITSHSARSNTLCYMQLRPSCGFSFTGNAE